MNTGNKSYLNSIKPVNKAPRVIFLESQEGTESLFTRGLRTGAVAAGCDVELVFLADATGRPRSEKQVRIDLLVKQPDTVCFLMDAPLDLKNLWEVPSLAAVDKISLWFDDYYRSPKTLARPDVWTKWQKVHGVRVGIWDGYWRHQWKRFTGVDAFPIHLAADHQQLHPNAEPWKREWSERAAFVGTIPSQKSLDVFGQAFPAPLRRFLEEVCIAMQNEPWPLRPYEVAQKCRSFIGEKYGRAIDAMLKEPATLAIWNHLLWRWGKRIARLRGLAAVAKAGPIAIMSGHGTEAYAGEDELRAALPQGTDLVYADTKEIHSTVWKSLFTTGKFQVQITDPQSIEGGLPFRVFECGACGVPLLSDHRPELAALFPPDSGIFTAANEAGLQETANRMFGMSAGELEARGELLNQNFLARHTWEMRWKQLVQGHEFRSPETRFDAPPSAVAPTVPIRTAMFPQAA